MGVLVFGWVIFVRSNKIRLDNDFFSQYPRVTEGIHIIFPMYIVIGPYIIF